MNEIRHPIRPFRNAVQLFGNDAVGKVVFVEGFLSPAECDKVLAESAGLSETEGLTGRDGQKDLARDSRIKFVWPSAEWAWLFDKLELAAQRLNQQYNYDLMGFYEGAQIATYQAQGEYGWHVDLGESLFSARKLSLSIQLSDASDYEGGDLEFIGPTDTTAPRGRGALIAFPSFVTHRVAPVTRGTRRSLVSWISGRPFR
ncbi:MAG: 2OG-Fe(II) oxygenase [Pseudomonadota bacterium]